MWCDADGWDVMQCNVILQTCTKVTQRNVTQGNAMSSLVESMMRWCISMSRIHSPRKTMSWFHNPVDWPAAYRDDLSEGIDRPSGQSEPALIDGQRGLRIESGWTYSRTSSTDGSEKSRCCKCSVSGCRPGDGPSAASRIPDRRIPCRCRRASGLPCDPPRRARSRHTCPVYVDRVHDRVLLIHMDQSEHVTYLVDSHLEQVDSGSVRIDALVVLILVEMDVAGCPRVSQLASVAVERLIAIHVVLWIKIRCMIYS